MSAAQTKKIEDGDVKEKQNATSNVFDCKFIVGEKLETVYGSKFQFAIESPVFESMLFGDFKEADASEEGIPLPEDDPKSLRHFRLLACCTSSRESRLEALTIEDLINLTRFCQKYLALTISKLCTDRLETLIQNASINDLTKLLDCREIFPETDKLRMIYEERLRSNSYPVNAFMTGVCPITFKNYIAKVCSLATRTTIELFNTIEKYLEHNDLIPKSLLDQSTYKKGADGKKDQNFDKEADEKKREYMKELLKGLDFGRLNGTQDFFLGPSDSKLLTIEQKYLILKGLCQNKKPIKLYEENSVA